MAYSTGKKFQSRFGGGQGVNIYLGENFYPTPNHVDVCPITIKPRIGPNCQFWSVPFIPDPDERNSGLDLGKPINDW